MDKQKYKQLALSFGISEKDFSQLLIILQQWGWTSEQETEEAIDETQLLEESKQSDSSPKLTHQESSEYKDIQQLGKGGMGEVRKVQDQQLNRMVALKSLHSKWKDDHNALSRFLKEAQLTSQLQHPGIAPVFDFGHKSDGSPYFTMPEIKGRTFGSLLREASKKTVHTFSRQRLNDFHQVCKTLAYAHSRGVIHCDIKPDNIMLGEFGEVYVLDWGLSIVTEPLDGYAPIQILPVRERDLIGTPLYMSPEQVLGEAKNISFSSDVYSLGILLFQILMGKKPLDGTTESILEKIKDGELQRIPKNMGIPNALIKIYQRATQFNAKDRYKHASQMAVELENWLIGAQQEERATNLVAQAKAKQPKIEQLKLQADFLVAKANDIKQQIAPWSPEEDKVQFWETLDNVLAVEKEAKQAEMDIEQLLQGALLYSSECIDAHRELSLFYKQQHRIAEADKNQLASERIERMLRSHARALPIQDSVRLETIQYLKGDGAFSLETNPPGATVNIFEYQDIQRQLKPVFLKTIRETPIIKETLPIGSYLLEIVHQGREKVLYPIFIERLSHWTSTPPGLDTPEKVWLPPLGTLSQQECYIPSGWFISGGDPHTSAINAKRIWVDGFIIDKYPVTNQEYIKWLNYLVDNDQEDLALTCTPQHNYGSDRRIYGRDQDGHFILKIDAEGDMWHSDWPVVMVDWHSCSHYTRWRSSQSNHQWRLPLEMEWEKSARGVDGRFFPWGNFFEPSRCCNRHSDPVRQLLTSIDDFPMDKSPYGVRGMAGNTGDWCLDPYHSNPRTYKDRAIFPAETKIENREHIFRGGSWAKAKNELRVACRFSNPPVAKVANIGFRCATSLKLND